MQHISLRTILIFALFSNFAIAVTAQNLPSEYSFSADGRVLSQGAVLADGLYDRNLIREVHFDFPQTNYWTLLTNNYESETEIPASLTIDGVTYDSVGIRFRGNTSYMSIENSQKKSFAISTDLIHQDQQIAGYNNLKFNNGHQDPSFMREVLYCRMAKQFIPIAKANYIHLFINGQDWGIYPNIQSVDKTFLEEWFLSNDGARFRATTDGGGPGGPGGGGPSWGDGTAGMNYLSADTSEYQQYYDLKSSDIEGSWQKLVDACEVLDNTSLATMAEANNKLDIDKILWFLAVENIFADDDSYVMKGKMDYCIYYEPETDRTMPLEYDGNSSFFSNAATSWTPFKNVSNANYPLLNKLITIPEWRQRYLAHYRTILRESFTTQNANAIIDSIDAQIKSLVAADTKKLYPTSQYTTSVNGLKTFVSNRRNFLMANAEVAQVAPEILRSTFFNAQLEESVAPLSNEVAYVTAQVTSAAGVSAVNLYYDEGLVGTFQSTEMFDDGGHQDGVAGDGLYGGVIPGFIAGTLVRYYIEAVAANATLSVSYLPAGAEHDVFVYTVEQAASFNGVVINEFVALNTTGPVDEGGDHADWIELYNNNNFNVDLSGFYLTDDGTNPDKWQFPAGTIIEANGYLIIWADEEGSEGDLHTNFKLSGDGEEVILSDALLNILDETGFGTQTNDVAYARVPNGTGDFVFQSPTFNANNDISTGSNEVFDNSVKVYPNPFSDFVIIEINAEEKSVYSIYDMWGRIMMNGELKYGSNQINLTSLNAGAFVVKIKSQHTALPITQKIFKF